MTDVEISVRLWRESGQNDWTILLISSFQNFFWIQCGFHFPTDKFRNIFDMENFFFWGLLAFFLLLGCLLWGFFLLVSGNIFRKSFGFPDLFEWVFECFSFNKWKFFLDFDEEVHFFRLLIGASYVLFNDFLDLFWSKLNSNTAVFDKFLHIHASFRLLVFQVLNGVIKLTGIGNFTTSNVFGKNLSVVGDGLG